MTTGIECDQCSATFTLKSSLMKHIKQVHNKIRYPCEECEKSYTSKQNLLYHIQSVHLKVKHYCNFCTSVFKLKAGLKHHLQSKHTSFITPSIWIWFSNAVDVNQTSKKKNLQQHMRIRHGFKKYKCNQCNFHSDDRSNVARHEKTTH